jgi:nicotinate phosphoribosyltransferase
MARALSTDLYELKMAASYLRRGFRHPATFSLFIRRLPPDRGFLVAAGIEDCLSYLENLRFAREELEYLATLGFDEKDIEALADFSFTGGVRCVPEGRIVLADEPILEVSAPIAEAQLVETYLLNQVTFQTAFATKAARCVMAAGEIELFDFALRRTHGVEAADALARVSAIAGFKGTSNVDAARRFGLTAVGTMAHSYVEAFPSESAAFRAFAEDFPQRTVFLVDTYDIPVGVDRAIAVIAEMGLRDASVRIDSGDLAAQSRDTRRRLDAAGLGDVRVVVSGGIDEFTLERFRLAGDPIDAAGIGMAIGVSYDAPTLDSAYKLVDFDGRPTMKLSAEKVSLPGAKQVWRGVSIADDVLSLEEETGPQDAAPLLQVAMRDGNRTTPAGSIASARRYLEEDLARLPEDARRLRAPDAPKVSVSHDLGALADTVAERLRA